MFHAGKTTIFHVVFVTSHEVNVAKTD